LPEDDSSLTPLPAFKVFHRVILAVIKKAMPD
jgi:hypothetical protein